MKKQILITIGREYGSGGHDLAALLSQRLGIRMLDRELIDELWKNDPEMKQLAQQYGFSVFPYTLDAQPQN